MGQQLVAGFFLLSCITFSCEIVKAEELTIGVAANFSAPIKTLATDFEKTTGHVLRISLGSTGTLFAQINQGAPFDVFLSADEVTPNLLIEKGLALPSPSLIYATGKLVLWSSDLGESKDLKKILMAGDFRRLAVASSKLAPYGLAAKQTLQKMGLWEQVTPKIIEGKSIGQTYNFIATKNVDFGFIALSQLGASHKETMKRAWVVPSSYHQPLRQKAVVLSQSTKKNTASIFMKFLSNPSSQAVIRSYGYE